MELSFLSESEQKQRQEIIDELNDAILQRQQTYTELDDMTYDHYYLSNKKAASGYIRPKKNKQDLRTVTGTTREKVNTVVTALLRYNFEFEISAFDEKEWNDRDLGFGLEGLVRKSRKLEKPTYDRKRALFYNEFAAQGNLFLYENNVEEEVVRKKIENDDVDDVFKVSWKQVVEMEKRSEVDMVPGINVYLGNIREYYMDSQPFIGIRRELSRATTKRIYGGWKRYKQMGEYAEKEQQVLTDMGGQEYNDWRAISPKDNFDEEIRYFNVHTNTYQILLNGVPMLPKDFPLEYLFGVCKYPIIKVDAEPISRNFAYSRGISAKNKFNQAIIDEMFRIIVLKFRKSTNPPMANLSGKVLNKSIFYPGTIHTGVDPEKLKQIGENNTVTGPEFSTFQLVKSAIDESSVSPILEGNRTPGEQTAKEISELKSQSLMRLGMIIVGIILMEEELVWLRAYNILKHWTQPIDVKVEKTKEGIKKMNVYRRESVDSKFDDGTQGIHMIEMGESVKEPERILAEENILTKKKGVPVRKTYLNAKDLASLKYKLYVKVVPIEKDHSELKAALFEESMLKAFQMFPESINKPYFQEEWANHVKIDPRKAFISVPPVSPMAMRGMGEGAPMDKTVGAQVKPQTTQQNKPSLKRMM